MHRSSKCANSGVCYIKVIAFLCEYQSNMFVGLPRDSKMSIQDEKSGVKSCSIENAGRVVFNRPNLWNPSFHIARDSSPWYKYRVKPLPASLLSVGWTVVAHLGSFWILMLA